MVLDKMIAVKALEKKNFENKRKGFVEEEEDVWKEPL